MISRDGGAGSEPMKRTDGQAGDLAPAERASAAELEQAIRAAATSPVLDGVMQCLGAAVAVLNAQRQVLAINDSYLALAGIGDAEQALGLRSGETLHCAYAEDSQFGCGNGRYCVTCGAALAILAAQREGAPQELECAMVTTRDGVRHELAMLARATPLRVDDQVFLLLALKDISEEKLRAALEHSFLHDVSNLVAGLAGSAGFLDDPEQNPADVFAEIRAVTEQLRREIELQRILLCPEPRCGKLVAAPVSLAVIVQTLLHLVRRHHAAQRREVRWPVVSPDAQVVTDVAALLRVLLNMLLNALEATDEGGAVELRVEVAADQVVFRVWNPAAIPPAVALRVFQRYFSTKAGRARGQGTFTMKMLGEGYLGGKVGFSTSASAGTTFWLILPRV